MPADPTVTAELSRLLATLTAARATKVGFPGAEDIDYGPLAPLLDFELNNIGDPYDDPVFGHHTKAYEREAVDFFADLFRAPADDRWGYVTSGSTECIQYGLLRARRLYPDGLVYHCSAAHYKVPRVVQDLRMTGVVVPADPHGEISYGLLRDVVDPDRPVIVVATAGTTMTEAVDDIGLIGQVLDEVGALDRYVHVDAALAAIPLGLLPPDQRPHFDFADGADSLGFSTHKFLAGRWPGGLVLSRQRLSGNRPGAVTYTGAADTVVAGSRNGHTALQLWYCARTLGVAGLRARAEAARDTAAYLVERLTGIGWPAWRNPHAFTVVLKSPPPAVARTWALASEQDGWSHYVCMPGRDRGQVDDFIDALRAAGDEAPPSWREPAGRRRRVRPRRPIRPAAAEPVRRHRG